MLTAAVATLCAGPVLTGHLATTAAAPAGVDRQAWSQTGALPPPMPREGLLYVSSVGGQEQARAFVSFTSEGRTAAELAASSLVLKEDPSTLGAANSALTACPLTAPLTGDGRLAEPPAADCDVVEPLVRADDGTWSLPLQRLASAVADGQGGGVAIVPSLEAGAPQPYWVAFDAAATTVARAPATALPARPSGTGTATSSDPADRPAATGSGDGPFAGSSGDVVLPVSAGPESLAPLDVSGTGTSEEPEVSEGPQLAAEPATSDEPAVTVLSVATAQPAADVPSSTNSVPLVLGVVLIAAALWLGLSRFAGGVPAPPVLGGLSGAATRRLPLLLPFLLLLVLDEAATYKVGLIGIVFIAAIGLHILVNTAGELSLAHAALLGIPAFVVAQVAARTPLDSLTALPVGVLAGAAIGFLVALTAQRARGLQVALVTLAVAIATVQFLFFQEWFIGPAGGFELTAPSVFGQELSSQSARAPFLAAVVVLAAAAGSGILRSKLGRALAMVRSDPDVAATVGIPASRYRGMAYTIAGAFAGLAGACYAFWVQIVTPQAFPLQLGFTYLLIAALAGRGGLAGVAISTAAVQAGVLFDFLPRSFTLYVAPIALILQVTRYEGGINALLRTAGARLRTARGLERSHEPEVLSDDRSATMPLATPVPAPGRPAAVRVGFATGSLLAFAGLVSITVAWYNTGRTNQLWIQNQEIVSGGLIGVSLVVLGCTLILRDALLYGRAPLGPTAVVAVPAEGASAAAAAPPAADAVDPGATAEAYVPSSRKSPRDRVRAGQR